MLLEQCFNVNIGVRKRVAYEYNFSRQPDFPRGFAQQLGNDRIAQRLYVGRRHDERLKLGAVQRAVIVVFGPVRRGVADEFAAIQIDLAVPGCQQRLVTAVAVLPVQAAVDLDDFVRNSLS
jgi:hypothetical protein